MKDVDLMVSEHTMIVKDEWTDTQDATATAHLKPRAIKVLTATCQSNE